jgi:hypothetical protein
MLLQNFHKILKWGVLNLVPHDFNAIISVKGRQLLNKTGNVSVGVT